MQSSTEHISKNKPNTPHITPKSRTHAHDQKTEKENMHNKPSQQPITNPRNIPNRSHNPRPQTESKIAATTTIQRHNNIPHQTKLLI